MKVLVFLFHRDLRLVDHYGLEAAAEEAKRLGAKLLPIFIFTPEQVTEKNPLKSTNSIQFMLQSLKELATTLRQKGTRLLLFYGDTIDILESLKNELTSGENEFVGLGETTDYTPSAKKREERTVKWVSGSGSGSDADDSATSSKQPTRN